MIFNVVLLINLNYYKVNARENNDFFVYVFFLG